MVAFYILIVLLLLWGIRIPPNVESDYLEIDTTQSVKGIFILFVFLSHASQYLQYTSESLFDSLFYMINGWLSQLIVVLFLFYSGYGVTLGAIRKKESYITKFPRKRILTVLLNFDIAVAVFFVLSLCIGKSYDVPTILLSLIGWESLGNSNWYIFVILLCYFLSYISFRITSSLRKSVIFLLVLCAVAMMILLHCKPYWWYDTILSYPIGALWAVYKDKIDKIIDKNVLFILISLFILVLFKRLYLETSGLGYAITANLRGLSLIVFINTFLHYVSIGNKILVWLGRNLFPLYIYQRVPMIVLANVAAGALTFNPYYFIPLSLLLTLPFAELYKRIEYKG